MKKLVLFFTLLFIFAFGFFSQVMAVDGDALNDRGEEVRDKKQGRREEIIDKRKDRREEIKDRVQDRREEFKDKIEDRREEIKAKMEARREELKQKLQEFKDKKKAKIAERVSNNLNKINDNRVEAMTKHLEHIEELLEKVEERTANAKAGGKDVAMVETAIADAHTAIDSARDALATQASKDYTLVVTDEDKVKEEAKAKREALHSDLKVVHELVVAARKAVSNAISTAYSTLGKENVDNENEE